MTANTSIQPSEADTHLAGTEQNNPIRVVMVVRLFHPWIGGTEIQCYRLAKKLIEKHVDVHIVTGWWFRGTSQKELFDSIPVFRNQTLWEFFGIKGMRKFGGYLYLLSLIWHLWSRRADFDVIHIHGFSYHAFAAALASRWCRHKTVVKLANSGNASDIDKMLNNYELALSKYMLPTALTCDHYIAVNKKVFEELVEAGVPPGKVTELSNGVDYEDIPVKENYVLQNPARLIFIGRLHTQKGLDTLLTAFSQVLRLYPAGHLCLQLVGEGPLSGELSRLAAHLGITDHVDFSGRKERVLEHLSQADIFVLPSWAEGLSNALLEAMACALPVVVSDIPGNVDVISHGQNGLLFKVGDPLSLVHALDALLKQPSLRERLGKAARLTIEKQYSLDSIADQTIALYQKLLLPEN